MTVKSPTIVIYYSGLQNFTQTYSMVNWLFNDAASIAINTIHYDQYDPLKSLLDSYK